MSLSRSERPNVGRLSVDAHSTTPRSMNASIDNFDTDAPRDAGDGARAPSPRVSSTNTAYRCVCSSCETCLSTSWRSSSATFERCSFESTTFSSSSNCQRAPRRAAAPPARGARCGGKCLAWRDERRASSVTSRCARATRTLPRLLPSARAGATTIRRRMPTVSSSGRPCSSASRVTGETDVHGGEVD